MKFRRIIDKRKKEKFMMDDEYLNGMAKLCGWKGTIVYNSLCRHANKDQECFPSINLMAKQHNVSRPTILKGIDALETRNVIDVTKKRSKRGKWLNNTYILLDKRSWDYSQVNKVDSAEAGLSTPFREVTESTRDILPSQCSLSSQVNGVDIKETNGKETHEFKETNYLQNEDVLQNNKIFKKNNLVNLPMVKKELAIDIFSAGKVEPTAGAKLNEAIALFEPILPGDFVGKRSAYKKNPTREAVAALLTRYTLDQLAELIWKFNECKHDEYCPKVGTVYEFATSKLAKIEHHVTLAEPCLGRWDPSKRLTIEKINAQNEEHRQMMEGAHDAYDRLMGRS